MSAPKDPKKSKWGLGGMLHKDKERPAPVADSTYGSADGSYNSSAAQDRDSYASSPSFTGSERSQQGLGQNQFINDQGQVVTTTTTTTTVTTTGGGGASHTSGPHASNIANKIDPRVHSSSDQTYQTEVQEVRREPERPNIPAKNPIRERSPQPPSQQQRQAPQIQSNNNIRNNPREEFGDATSPNGGRHNFSYPSRTPPPTGQVGAPPPQGQSQYGAQQPNYGAPQANYGAPQANHGAPMQGNNHHQPGGTLQNLKTAAVGLHGVGETLRGTLNNGIDKRFDKRPETQLHNQAVLDAGRSEIQNGHLSHTNRQAGGVGNPVKGILRKRDGDGQLRVVNE